MLHGNAALGWHGRRFLAQRVVVDGWTLAAAAEAAAASVRCARKWVGRYRADKPDTSAHASAARRKEIVRGLSQRRDSKAHRTSARSQAWQGGDRGGRCDSAESDHGEAGTRSGSGTWKGRPNSGEWC